MHPLLLEVPAVHVHALDVFRDFVSPVDAFDERGAERFGSGHPQ